MELFQAQEHFIVQQGEKALWCSRKDGSLHARSASALLHAWNPVCLGLVEGVIGKIKLFTEDEWRLVLIRQKELVGELPGGHRVYKISRIVCVPLFPGEPVELDLELCKKHHFGISKSEKLSPTPEDSKFMKTINHLKSNVPIKKKGLREGQGKERLERRLLEELLKMFTDSNSFYFSPTYDITNTVQRQRPGKDTDQPIWKKADDRFFWNKVMLQDLIDSKDKESDFWIMPIIQGYVQIEKMVVNYAESPDDERCSPEIPAYVVHTDDVPLPEFLVALVSRRSRHRAGMRYKRRGVDRHGHVANYVETEQLVHIYTHTLSFTLTRGSVPLFWSQAGYTYNPRPRFNKGEKENTAAFAAHFGEQLKIYQKQVIVNLVDQAGREKSVGDAFLKHILKYDHEDLSYITFDFHEHCRGMKLENVRILTDAIRSIITGIKWCWADSAGIIQEQQGVFRVNCMDCLDRTNVVQAAIARVVLEGQLQKLGAIPPDHVLPTKCRRTYQVMWANNGDTISRQYAGTAALKGDFTRTGERRLAGVMRDGYNSANRYYLNQFRDAYRQATIDLMQGLPVRVDLTALVSRGLQHESLVGTQKSQQEQVGLLLQRCMSLLLPATESFHGGWALIDCDASLVDATHKDVDVLLILTNRAYYVAYFDGEAEKVTHYQRIPMEDLEKIEIGPEPTIFGRPKFVCMRLHSVFGGATGYFHTLRVGTCTGENNGKDTLECIAEIFTMLKEENGTSLSMMEGKLEKRKSKPHEEIITVSAKEQSCGWAAGALDALPQEPDARQGLAQSQRYLVNVQRNVRSKFTFLNEKMRQSKPGMNLGNLGSNIRRISAFRRPSGSPNLLRPESAASQVFGSEDAEQDGDSDISISDSESVLADDYFELPAAKSDDERRCSEKDVLDYVLPSCGIVASSSPSNRSVEAPDTSPPSPTCTTSRIIITDCSDPEPRANAPHHSLYSLESSENKTTVCSTTDSMPRPSRLDIMEVPKNASAAETPGSADSEPDGSTRATSSDGGSRAASPFARIKSSVVSMANMPSSLGLLPGQSPESEAQQETTSLQELEDLISKCKTSIVQV
uniref:phosphatidylinositide phosphatase SAC2 isoform X1 n=1 Tax=Myxine glutinosa TaxID=7769 RepID=UPI00358E7CFE